MRCLASSLLHVWLSVRQERAKKAMWSCISALANSAGSQNLLLLLLKGAHDTSMRSRWHMARSQEQIVINSNRLLLPPASCGLLRSRITRIVPSVTLHVCVCVCVCVCVKAAHPQPASSVCPSVLVRLLLRLRCADRTAVICRFSIKPFSRSTTITSSCLLGRSLVNNDPP